MTAEARTPEIAWRAEGNTGHLTRGHWLPPFSIYECRATGRCVMTSGSPFFAGPVQTDTLAEAKAAVATILKETDHDR